MDRSGRAVVQGPDDHTLDRSHLERQEQEAEEQERRTTDEHTQDHGHTQGSTVGEHQTATVVQEDRDSPVVRSHRTLFREAGLEANVEHQDSNLGSHEAAAHHEQAVEDSHMNTDPEAGEDGRSHHEELGRCSREEEEDNREVRTCGLALAQGHEEDQGEEHGNCHWEEDRSRCRMMSEKQCEQHTNRPIEVGALA